MAAVAASSGAISSVLEALHFTGLPSTFSKGRLTYRKEKYLFNNSPFGSILIYYGFNKFTIPV